MQAEEMPARVQKVVSSGEDWQDVCGGIADVKARLDQRRAVYRVRAAALDSARLLGCLGARVLDCHCSLLPPLPLLTGAP